MQKKNILIVDDSKMVNNLLHDELLDHAEMIMQEYTVADAKKALETATFDLAIIDLHLPDGTGQEIVKFIKKHTPETKIIIFTANTSELDRYKLFNYGILDYYVKDSTIRNSIEEIKEQIVQLDYNKNFSILIIDDSMTVRTSLKILFEPRNFNVLESPTGEGGIELLKQHDVHMIILDMELPDIHGLKVLEKIKSSIYDSIPVIVLSGKTDPALIRKTYKLGAAEFLHKPHVAEEMMIKINYWIQRYRAQLELDCSNQLLQEYKDTIDESNIVSKSNTKGIITYVNDEFCEISGYARYELIGKPHNIIRHPDMDADVFQNLWQTIQDKKTWKGIVKNRKKDGSHYWVDTIIKPIIDSEGNILEYIGIRHDITEIQDIKERLNKELNITSQNFQEAYQLSKEYEKAIEESNILSRTDLNGRITYVNKAFEQSSGYTREEIIGKPHSVVRHPDTPTAMIKEIWSTLQAGRIWKGLIKNRRKDGTPYWVNSVILPIKDAQGNNTEYMSIRNDVSEIMQLHIEIENTQKELIYRMGELAESRSKETGNHIKRVAAYSKLLAQKYGMSEEESELLYMASPMHDIGKLSTPDAILKKPGTLDDEEWKIMRDHCNVGYELLKSSDKPILQASAIVAQQHHEKWNGNGYPQGLKGEDIHIFGRITAIADVFDALGSERCYKAAWEDEKIIKLFEEERGEHFDPQLVDIFLENIEDIFAIRERYKDSF